jgi:hypothetical protein
MPNVWRYRKGNTVKINGLDVTDVTYKEPGNNLPKWVREAAVTRGYGDSQQPLSLFIQDADIAEAFACAAQGNGSACVMAQAGKRIGAQSVYFYRTTAWVDFGKGPIVRFKCSKQIYENVISPFDHGDRDAVAPGIYHLTPPTSSGRLSVRREQDAKKRATNPAGKQPDVTRGVVAHTERVVMAAQT